MVLIVSFENVISDIIPIERVGSLRPNLAMNVFSS